MPTRYGRSPWIDQFPKSRIATYPTHRGALKVDAAGDFETLHGFNYTDGASPEAGVIQGDDGSLYGVTVTGGQ